MSIMKLKRLFHRYGLTIFLCGFSAFLSMLWCWSTCELKQCKDACKNVDNKYIINRHGEIRISNTASKTFLVILIFSSTNNMEQRDTIRQTWLKSANNLQVLHYFAIGTEHLDNEETVTIKSEQARFGDLLLLPSVKDSYHTLTLKLLKALIWLSQNLEFTFLLKVDDDSFVKVDVMVEELHTLKNKQRFYWGFFNGHAQVKKTGFWQEKDWILCDSYLPYALGGGYVVSSDIVAFIVKNHQYLKLYNSEDVSMGTWLAGLDVNRIHDPRFDTEYKSRGCFNAYIVTHKQSAEQMREKYSLLKEKGKMCSEQFRTRHSYIYNWKVPPSRCCIRNDSKIP